MRKSQILNMALIQVAVFGAAAALPAQTPTQSLRAFGSSRYEDRREAFDQLTMLVRNQRTSLKSYVRQHPEVSAALIALLERENRPDPAKDALPEDSYIGDLIMSVAQLKDPRAVYALAGAIATGKLAEDGLVALGQSAVPVLVNLLRSPSEHEMKRAASAKVLGEIASAHSAVRVDTSAIRAALVASLRDPSMFVRRKAVLALESFADQEIREAMQSLAASDSATRMRAGKRIFPVRDAAQLWLQRDSATQKRVVGTDPPN